LRTFARDQVLRTFCKSGTRFILLIHIYLQTYSSSHTRICLLTAVTKRLTREQTSADRMSERKENFSQYYLQKSCCMAERKTDDREMTVAVGGCRGSGAMADLIKV